MSAGTNYTSNLLHLSLLVLTLPACPGPGRGAAPLPRPDTKLQGPQTSAGPGALAISRLLPRGWPDRDNMLVPGTGDLALSGISDTPDEM